MGPDGAGRRDAPRRYGRARDVRADLCATARTLPVVLDVVGAGGARFLSELVVGSRAATDVTFPITYTPSPGFAGPGGTLDAEDRELTIPAGREIRAADALAYLRSLGMAIPGATPEAPVAGSVTLRRNAAGKVDDTYLIARTYTRSASGRDLRALLRRAVGPRRGRGGGDGLRPPVGARASRARTSPSSTSRAAARTRSRSPCRSTPRAGSPAGAPLVRTLAPGEWTQWNGILGLAGLPDGSYGYARIRRTAGVGAFAAYGVVNDARTSDGSYLPAFRPGGLAAARTRRSSRSSSTSTARPARTTRPR